MWGAVCLGVLPVPPLLRITVLSRSPASKWCLARGSGDSAGQLFYCNEQKPRVESPRNQGPWPDYSHKTSKKTRRRSFQIPYPDFRLVRKTFLKGRRAMVEFVG